VSAYADTSFLVSLYVLDANSAHAAARMKQASLPIFLTPLGEIELTNAFCLRLFRKELVSREVERAQALFAGDIASGVFERKPLTPAVFDTAKRIARKRTPRYGTRTLDVLHVASALVLRADTFYTFDLNQAKLARAEGLAVL
jgi:predicted nucleic acid-binding protein